MGINEKIVKKNVLIKIKKSPSTSFKQKKKKKNFLACIVLGDTLFTTSAGIISCDSVNFLTSNKAESSQQGRRSRKKTWDLLEIATPAVVECHVNWKHEGGQVWSSKWSQILDCSQSGGWLFYKHRNRKNYSMLHMRNNHTNSSNRYTRSTASHWYDW